MACDNSKWLIEAVEQITSPAGTARPPVQNVSIRRVGRNMVWRIARHGAPQSVYYAKCWSDRRKFARELTGLALFARIAQEHAWIGCPKLVHVDDDRGILVTAAIDGISFESHLKASLARGVAFHRMNECARQVQTGFDLLLRLAQCLHATTTPDVSDLARHDGQSVRHRIQRMASRLLGMCRPRSAHALEQLASGDLLPSESNTCGESLVYGDFSPGNVFLRERQVIPIDFEDLGVGPACRDFAYLSYMLEQFGRQWRYRSAKCIAEKIPKCMHSARSSMLYRIEFLLSHMTAVLSRDPSRRFALRALDRMELRWLERELVAGCHSLN
jgi:hypothetical protein